MTRRGRGGARALADDERSDARERALIVFYEAQAKGIEPVAVADAQIVPLDELSDLLVRGVGEHRGHLDETIATNAKGWTLARMPAIDLAVLRIGAYELFHRPEVPVAVILDEAVELAKRFSTDDSGRFVNGVLATIARQARPTATSQARPTAGSQADADPGSAEQASAD